MEPGTLSRGENFLACGTKVGLRLLEERDIELLHRNSGDAKIRGVFFPVEVQPIGVLSSNMASTS